ncbi:MAG TPA: family 2A encapsulin nanocompartment cargo protein cysteine desulfurase [Oculatellaceae cyanobacterium]
MTTSDPNKKQSANGVSRNTTGTGYGASSYQAPLNEAMFANLANEFMAALPGALQIAQVATPSASELGVFLQQVDAVLPATNQTVLPSVSSVSSVSSAPIPNDLAGLTAAMGQGTIPGVPGIPSMSGVPGMNGMPSSSPGYSAAIPAVVPGGMPTVPGSAMSGLPNGLPVSFPGSVPSDIPMPFSAGALPSGVMPSGAVPSGVIPALFPASVAGGSPAGMSTTMPTLGGFPMSAPSGITSSSFTDPSQISGALAFLQDSRPLLDSTADLTKMAESMFASPFSIGGLDSSAFNALVSPHGLESDFADVAKLLQSADSTFGTDSYLSTPIAGGFNVESVRRDFPILNEVVNGRKLVWFDNAATTQKPQYVIDRLKYFYEHENSNIHRAAHELAARSTDAYERARESVRRFINAPSVNEIVFVRGATEGINFIAQSWGRKNVQKDDEIVISWLEHHANIVPWQMLCAEKGARLRVAPVDDHGQIILDEYERLLNHKTVLVSITQVSNALGTVTPVKEMIDAAHRVGAKVIVDGAQAISHMSVDVQEYDCDFYVFSGHKVYAPTGIGVVYGKSNVLEGMPPWQGGGNMIQDVTFERTVYQPPPGRFEAGTGNIADAIGLGAAIEYLERIGMHNVSRHEAELLRYMTERLSTIPGLHVVGTAAEKAGVVSFVLDGFKTDEVSKALNLEGIAVRGGHHCAQPILRRFGLESSVRASLGVYNTCEDVDALVAALWKIVQGRGGGPL